MASRAEAFTPSSTTSGATPRSSPASIAARNLVWSSRSDDIARLVQSGPGLRSLGPQHRELRHVGVPLDQRRGRAEMAPGMLAEPPHGIGDRRAVIVDEDRPPAAVVRGVTGQVHAADARGPDRIEP